MKRANEISIVIPNGEKERHTAEEIALKQRTKAFVASVMSLYYADISAEKLDGFKAICAANHPAIVKFSDDEFSNRLKMIKAITAVPNMTGLHGNYKTANNALRIACGELCNLQHDYYVVTPKNYATGAIEAITAKQIEYYANPEAAKETAKKGLNQLKGIFGGSDEH